MPTGVQLRRPVEILLVEDSPSDAKLTLIAFEKGKVNRNINHVVDGVLAIEYLNGEGAFAGKPTPDVVLLDLNLPKKNGIEVLEAMQSDESLRRIPVIVLTTSEAEEDIRAAYELNARAYVKKPVNMDDFAAAIQAFDEFWLTFVMLPPNKKP